MKYCKRCGQQIDPTATFCPYCGLSLIKKPKKESGIETAIKVLMVLGTIVNALCGYLIPLAWCIPMTISYFRKVRNGEPVGLSFKICSLLFVSLIGGILMLCDNDT